MIGVGENDARAQFFQRVLRETFYRGGSAHRHEYRRFDDSVGSRQLTSSRPRRIALQNFKRKTHSFSVSGENKRPERLDDNKRPPNRKRNDVGFGALQFFRIYGSEPNRNQD